MSFVRPGRRRHLRAALLLGLAAWTCSACWGVRPLRFDATRIRAECGSVGAGGLSEEQARCIAELAGLKDKKRCPLELRLSDDERSWHARESCSAMALRIDRDDGSIVEVELGSGRARAED